eukprot:scaffold38182_cov35-Tisochrysis_lutea.AAC.5
MTGSSGRSCVIGHMRMLAMSPTVSTMPLSREGGLASEPGSLRRPEGPHDRMMRDSPITEDERPVLGRSVQSIVSHAVASEGLREQGEDTAHGPNTIRALLL